MVASTGVRVTSLPRIGLLCAALAGSACAVRHEARGLVPKVDRDQAAGRADADLRSGASETGFSACRRRRQPVRGEMPFPARCGSAWPQP